MHVALRGRKKSTVSSLNGVQNPCRPRRLLGMMAANFKENV